MGTSKSLRTTWLVFAGLTALAIPLALYDPFAKRIATVGIAGAVITAICVAGLLAQKRWAIVVTGLRAAFGVVLGFMHLSDAAQLAGGFSQIQQDYRIWATGGLAYLAFLAVASLVVFIRVERLRMAAEMQAEAAQAIRELENPHG